MKYTNYFKKTGKVYGVSSKFDFGKWNHIGYEFDDIENAEKWLNTEESNFRERELMSKTAAEKLCGKGYKFIDSREMGRIIIPDKLFNKLWFDALAQPDKELYIAEYGYPQWFDYIIDDIDVIVKLLANIHDVAHMSVKDMVDRSGMSQAEFACKFCIPLRTIESWCLQKRNCSDYIRLMMARSLGILEV